VIELSKKSKIPLHHGRLDLPGTPPSGVGVQGTVKVPCSHGLYCCKGYYRQEARKIWELPMETDLAYTRKDWVTILLDKLDEDAKNKNNVHLVEGMAPSK
jgi:hypothetical protein